LKRVAVWLLIFASGFAAGAFVAATWMMCTSRWFGAVGESFFASQYVFLQYQKAEYPEAKAALEKYLRYLDSMPPSDSESKPGQNPWLDERGIAFDKTLTLARLALLEERNGNQQAASKYWALARSYAAQAKWKDTSLENVRAIVEHLDANAAK
jgi:hypothetical protein